MANMTVIGDLLNYADGIIGSIIDFRIIATTNAKEVEIEEALMRPGRLSKHVHIGYLSFEEANNIYIRLIDADENAPRLDSGKYTLADVYAAAHHWNHRDKKDVVIEESIDKSDKKNGKRKAIGFN
jgi:SpoVK/Ycf46/Vps4 family AAA+-type ATPase